MVVFHPVNILGNEIPLLEELPPKNYPNEILHSQMLIFLLPSMFIPIGIVIFRDFVSFGDPCQTPKVNRLLALKVCLYL